MNTSEGLLQAIGLKLAQNSNVITSQYPTSPILLLKSVLSRFNFYIQFLEKHSRKVFYKKHIFKNFKLFTGNTLLFNFIKKRLQYRCFPVVLLCILQIFKNSCCEEHLQMAVSVSIGNNHVSFQPFSYGEGKLCIHWTKFNVF